MMFWSCRCRQSSLVIISGRYSHHHAYQQWHDYHRGCRSSCWSLHSFPAYGRCCCRSRSRHRRRRISLCQIDSHLPCWRQRGSPALIPCMSIVFIILYVYGRGGIFRVHGLCLTQGNSPLFMPSVLLCAPSAPAIPTSGFLTSPNALGSGPPSGSL